MKNSDVTLIAYGLVNAFLDAHLEASKNDFPQLWKSFGKQSEELTRLVEKGLLYERQEKDKQYNP